MSLLRPAYTMDLVHKPIESKYVHVGGSVPGWAASLIVVETPYKALKQTRELVTTTTHSLL